jgi:hypothetical protein
VVFRFFGLRIAKVQMRFSATSFKMALLQAPGELDCYQYLAQLAAAEGWFGTFT